MVHHSFKSKAASRKFFLTLLTIGIGGVSLIMPAIINVIFKTSMTIMDGGTFNALALGVLTLYMGANVAEKRYVDYPMAVHASNNKDAHKETPPPNHVATVEKEGDQ